MPGRRPWPAGSSPTALFYRRISLFPAEQTGLITQLTEDIVRKIFADLGPWLRQRPEVHISINLSVDDLRSPTLPTLLHNQLQHWGIAAEQIILEITERGFVDPETTMPVIAHYRQAGHRISIDDFGTGYSSLSYLQKLDVDTLKIDKSFVDTLEYRPLTPHIIEMAKALNLATVAEGVETESQRDWLRQHGVQYARVAVQQSAAKRAVHSVGRA